uniref:Uncharacterized protein n=1 Tax=Oryza sativa subsp. japonica TaxID=39947 RepID=Q6K2T6_ORYSJ|nr:hypothetical protein [Oryza sativa Japonica Group]BAD28885.1 hypothetical protein [Oryza sativa Japonica Group]
MRVAMINENRRQPPRKTLHGCYQFCIYIQFIISLIRRSTTLYQAAGVLLPFLQLCLLDSYAALTWSILSNYFNDLTQVSGSWLLI